MLGHPGPPSPQSLPADPPFPPSSPLRLQVCPEPIPRGVPLWSVEGCDALQQGPGTAILVPWTKDVGCASFGRQASPTSASFCNWGVNEASVSRWPWESLT